LDNIWEKYVAKACDECYIVAMQGDLQAEDGRTLNIDSGVWLHHMVMYSGLGWTPGSKTDLVCSNTLLSGFLGWPHRIFASGNERTPVRLNTKFKFGMVVDHSDNFHLLYDLVNMANKPQKVYIVITYEWVPRSEPGYRPARMIWTDITGCGASEAAPKEGTYEMMSPGWTSTIGGVMLATLGHVHDGGVYTTLYVNEKPVCRSDQFYGTKPNFFEKPGIPNLSSEQMPMNGDKEESMSGHGDSGHAMHDDNKKMQLQPSQRPESLDHISAASSCVNFGILKVGDTIDVKATYNTTQHALNRAMHDHEQSLGSWLVNPSDKKYAYVNFPIVIANRTNQFTGRSWE